jgi:hypothetical protein
VKRDDAPRHAPQVHIRKVDKPSFGFDRRAPIAKMFNDIVRKATEPRADTDEQRTNTIDDSDKVSSKIKDLAASMIVAPSGKITEQQATHFILNTPHGRALFAHFSKQEKDTPMHINIHKLMPAIEIMEEGVQARAKLEKRDGESVAKSFTRLYEGDLDFRRTCKTVQEAKHFLAASFETVNEAKERLSKSVPMASLEPTMVGGKDAININDPAKATRLLTEQANRNHRTFEAELFAPENSALMEVALRRPTASSPSYDAEFNR